MNLALENYCYECNEPTISKTYAFGFKHMNGFITSLITPLHMRSLEWNVDNALAHHYHKYNFYWKNADSKDQIPD